MNLIKSKRNRDDFPGLEFPNFNDIMRDFFSIDKNTFYKGQFSPPVDINETENDVVLSMEIAGIDPNLLSITIDGSTLIIKGEKVNERKANKSTFFRAERSYGTFVRTFTLTDYVDSNGLKADYKRGVLTITLPKKEKTGTKQVKVNVQED